ncbi:hypothetical protein [Leptospira idonii]|uniref:DUF4105 domain-containing protein n=1 Tax=Leptospira idonii TaxID=1193500 RepID=A0A4R9M452_9LEPT|nr:hypothetical protein [Leptospira idonii]TGN20655.1 hypothetical protein EHS15_02000 [Leptospira idonii]
MFHFVRQPWEDFKLHYNVWENRSLELSELRILSEQFETFKLKWDEVYLIQKKWIENQKEIRRDKELLQSVSLGNSQIPIAGLGYFESAIDPKQNTPSPDLLAFYWTEEEKESIRNEILSLEKSTEDFHRTLFLSLSEKEMQTDVSIPPELSSIVPPKRYISEKQKWESWEQKKFFRNFLLNPSKPNLSEFFTLNQKEEFFLTEQDKSKLKEYQTELAKKIKECVLSSDCGGWEEMTLIIRMQSNLLSLNTGYFVFPKKTKTIPIYLDEEWTEIPKSVLDEKGKEVLTLFSLSKQVFLGKNYSSLAYKEWETVGTKINSLLTKDFNFEEIDPYPKSEGFIHKEFSQEQRQTAKEILPVLVKREADFNSYLSRIYKYHLIYKNCASEIFRYMNLFYPDEEKRNELLGGTVSDSPASFSFIPAVASIRVQKKLRILKVRNMPSYRILKKSQLTGGYWKDIREDFRFSSSSYRDNPYDHPFLFFTDDTIALRPIYGLTNLVWGLGNGAAGVIYLPFDKGKLLKKSGESVFFTVPELFFFNIRKGYFPYANKEDLPPSYFEKVQDTK